MCFTCVKDKMGKYKFLVVNKVNENLNLDVVL
jgi:hypothetical protein